MNVIRLIANLVIVMICISYIVITAESDDDDDDDWFQGEGIIWDPSDPLHEEWSGEVILAPAAGSDIPFTYNDYDFQVEGNATRGVIIVGNFSITGTEDVDIVLFGVNLNDQGERRIVGSSETGAPTERIDLDGTPDPEDIDDFYVGGTGTYTLRVYNYASIMSFVTYDVTVDIYYEGAEWYPEEGSQDSETR